MRNIICITERANIAVQVDYVLYVYYVLKIIQMSTIQSHVISDSRIIFLFIDKLPKWVRCWHLCTYCIYFQPFLYNPYSPFAPVVDTWAKDPLLPDHPYNLLLNKKVQDLPWITSYVSSEGLYPGSGNFSIIL